MQDQISPSEASRLARVRRGRWMMVYVTVIGLGLLAFDLYVWGVMSGASDNSFLVRMVVRNGIMLALLVFAWQGSNAARYVLGVLFLLGAIAGVWLFMQDNAALKVYGVTSAAALGAAALILLISASLGEFLADRRAARSV